MKTKNPPKQKTIKWSELKRLSFCNSQRLPQQIEIVEEREVRQKGKRKWKTEKVSHFKEWVGIGWVELLSYQVKNPVLVIDDEKAG